MKHRQSLVRRQKGAAAVEFALIAMVFFILLIGVLEMGRVLFTWNAAAEATRYGARVAAVCDINDSAILSRMQDIMPNLEAANVSVSYLPSGCNQSNYRRAGGAAFHHQPAARKPGKRKQSGLHLRPAARGACKAA